MFYYENNLKGIYSVEEKYILNLTSEEVEDLDPCLGNYENFKDFVKDNADKFSYNGSDGYDLKEIYTQENDGSATLDELNQIVDYYYNHLPEEKWLCFYKSKEDYDETYHFEIYKDLNKAKERLAEFKNKIIDDYEDADENGESHVKKEIEDCDDYFHFVSGCSEYSCEIRKVKEFN